jgi:hypothetical protein
VPISVSEIETRVVAIRSWGAYRKQQSTRVNVRNGQTEGRVGLKIRAVTVRPERGTTTIDAAEVRRSRRDQRHCDSYYSRRTLKAPVLGAAI